MTMYVCSNCNRTCFINTDYNDSHYPTRCPIVFDELLKDSKSVWKELKDL